MFGGVPFKTYYGASRFTKLQEWWDSSILYAHRPRHALRDDSVDVRARKKKNGRGNTRTVTRTQWPDIGCSPDHTSDIYLDGEGLLLPTYQLLWVTSHMKKQHLGGALQILSYGLHWMAPWKRASFVVCPVYSAEVEILLMCLLISEITSHNSRFSIRPSKEYY
jgi:hypothetical protein